MRLINFKLFIFLIGGLFCSTCNKVSTYSEINTGTFDAVLSGAINSQLKGEANFMIMNCASLNLSSGRQQLSFSDFCSTTQEGPKEGHFSIEAMSPILTNRESFVAYYEPCQECKKHSCRGVKGELVISEVRKDIVRGHFLFEAKPLDDKGKIIKDAEIVQFKGTFIAEGIAAED